jgi:hypothetical protein
LKRHLSRRSIYLGCAALHFWLICAVGCRGISASIAQGLTWLPRYLQAPFGETEQIAKSVTCQSLGVPNIVRQTVTSYLHSVGVEGGYGFFAPAVPNSYKLIFEFDYDDGHVEYDLPAVNGNAAGLRLTSLVDYIGGIDQQELREVLLKMLAFQAWQQHPDSVGVRTVFGYVEQPTAAEAARGQKETYKFLFAYDFNFRSSTPPSPAQ